MTILHDVLKMLHKGLFILFFSLFSLLSMAQTDLALARQYYAEQQYEKALEYLDKAEKQGPNNNIYRLKLNCFLALEDYKQAEKYIERNIKVSQFRNFDYYADLTYVLNIQKDYNKVDKLVDDLLLRVEKNPGLSYGLANAFQKKGYPKIALEIYQTAERVMPNSNYVYQKALLYGEMGDIRRMYESYVEMVELQPTYLPTVKQLLGRALQEDVDEENLVFLKDLLIQRIQAGGPETLNELLVYIFVKEKNFSGAFTQLRALDKRSDGAGKASLFNLGRVALNNKEYLTARRIFDYIAKDGNRSTYYEQALLYSLRTERERLLSLEESDEEQWQDLQEAYYKTRESLQGSPWAGDLVIDLADVSAFQLGETDTAIALLKDVLLTGYVSLEDHARAKIKLGDILLYRGERWEAIIYYGQAEKAFESSPIGQEAKFKRAKSAYYVGDFDWAQSIFNVLKASTSKLIANDALYYSLMITDNMALDTNTEALTMFARADLLHYQNQLDSAMMVLEMMEIAFVGHSIMDEVLFLKAGIYQERRQYQLAEEPLKEIIAEHGDDILADDAQYQLAVIYESRLSRKEEAMELYRQIFTDHPDSFYASEARKRYRELRGDVLN